MMKIDSLISLVFMIKVNLTIKWKKNLALYPSTFQINDIETKPLRNKRFAKVITTSSAAAAVSLSRLSKSNDYKTIQS